MITDLNGTVAILTGAAEGLGYEVARAYGREGIRLALMDVQADKLQRCAQEITEAGGDCYPITVDLADGEATQRAIDQAINHYGTPHILVHNAAVLIERTLLEISVADWQREVSIILQAAFILSKAVWPLMVEARRGNIVYLSSGSALRGFVKEAAYCPGKHGQEGLMRVLALEGEPYNIAVNTITPGAPINTPMSVGHYPDELREKWIDPALLTPAFVWLARQDDNSTTGQRLDAWKLSQSSSGSS